MSIVPALAHTHNTQHTHIARTHIHANTHTRKRGTRELHEYHINDIHNYKETHRFYYVLPIRDTINISTRRACNYPLLIRDTFIRWRNRRAADPPRYTTKTQV